MTRKSGKTNVYLKNFNQAIILDLVRTQKLISRAQISLLTGLSPTAAGKIVQDLIYKGYLEEKGIGDSKGGRKPVLVELKKDSFYSIGIGVDLNYFHFIMIDIAGNIKYEKELHLPDFVTFEEFIDKVDKTKESVLKSCFIEPDRLLGIGFSIPGIINNKENRLIMAPNIGWENIDLRISFEHFHPIPVFFENEANTSAICEKWMGLCQNTDDFVCLNIKSGMGAGIFVNGKLYTGNNGYAGEIGHTVVDESGLKCRCGNTGCIETYVALRDIDSIVREARVGNSSAKNALLESAKYIGIAIANLIETLNPSKIVIGKEFYKYADLVMEQVKLSAGRKSLKYLNSNMDIVVSETGEKSSVLGAAIIPLKQLFGKE